MKVKELIAKLKKCNEHAEVVLSADSEGNSFAPCTEVGLVVFDSDYEPCDTEDEEAMGCVVLWP